jgi:hypothetical protein
MVVAGVPPRRLAFVLLGWLTSTILPGPDLSHPEDAGHNPDTIAGAAGQWFGMEPAAANGWAHLACRPAMT